MSDFIDSIPKVGRPTVMTEEVLNKLRIAFAYGMDDLSACNYAGIHVRTLANYQEKHPDFIQIKQQLQMNPITYASQVLFNGLKDKPELALKVLERLSKKYGQKNEIELKSKGFEHFLEQIKDRGGDG